MVLDEEKQFHPPDIAPLYPSVLDSCSPLTSPPKRQHPKVRRKYDKHQSKNGCFVQYGVHTSNPLPGSVSPASCQYDTQVIVKVSNVKDDRHLANKDYKRRRLLIGHSTPTKMFIGKLAKSHRQQWKDNNAKHISECYGKKPIKTLGNMFQESVQRNDTIDEDDSSTKSDSSSRNGSCHVATVAEVHKDETKKRKDSNHTRENVEIMNEKNMSDGKEEKADKAKTDFSKFRKQTLKLTKYFTPGSKESGTHSKVAERSVDGSTQKHDDSCETSQGNGEPEFSQIEICKDSHSNDYTNNCYENPRHKSTAKENECNKYKSVGVHASPFPPFRLHFLPKEDWRDTDNKLHTFLKLVLSQCGLACVVLTWAMLGALVFRLTEGPQEQRQVEEMARQQSSLVIGLATDLRQVVPQEPIWRQTIERYADRHEALILSAVSSGYPQRGTIWTYPGSLLFATSLLTTLGFGAPVPRTVIGRMSAIVFAGLGIPMHLLLILNIGLLIVVKLTRLANICSHKVKFLKFKIQKVKSRRDFEGNSSPDWPEELFASEQTTPPAWLKFFPLVAIPMYYLTGFLLFGVARGKSFPEIFLFPLDFTAAGGVASTYGHLRIMYAMYLEGAVILASTNVALLRASATRGFTSAAIKLGLMTNSLH